MTQNKSERQLVLRQGEFYLLTPARHEARVHGRSTVIRFLCFWDSPGSRIYTPSLSCARRDQSNLCFRVSSRKHHQSGGKTNNIPTTTAIFEPSSAFINIKADQLPNDPPRSNIWILHVPLEIDPICTKENPNEKHSALLRMLNPL